MSQHDKHQYYFEKYLRNEMPEAERSAFDEKLAEDAALRMAFEYYRLNRDTLLAELIKEHKLTRRDNRLNKLIFLLISLTGIALTFNYFVYRQPTTGNTNPQPAKSNIFVRYVPFLNREPKSNRPVATPVAVHRTTVNKDTITNLEPSTDRDERLRSDLYQRDTFVTVMDKAGANAWLTFWHQTDSLGADSPATRPVFSKSNKAPIMLVEYWESPFGYKGYFLQKNTLVLYGIRQPKIIVYKEQHELFLMLPEKGRILITEQPNFTSF